MASNLAVKLEFGASISFTVGIALKSVEDRIKKNTQVLENIFAEVFRLGHASKPVADTGYSVAGELRPYLLTTHDLLQQQLVALRQQRPVLVTVGNAGAPATQEAPERDNLKAFEGLPVIGQAITVGRALAVPTQISAQYQKIIRDLAISAGVAGGAEPSAQEQQVIASVSSVNNTTGMERNQAATLIKQLYDTGMGLEAALAYAPVAARFSVGQDASTADTVRLIGELRSNPKVSGPAELEKALEHIVFQRKGTGEGAADKLSATQIQGLDKALDNPQSEGAKGVLDKDLHTRRETSDRRLSEASDAVDDSLRSLGDAIQPLSDGLAVSITQTAQAFTAAPDAIKLLIAGAAVLGTTLLAFKGGAVVENVLNKARQWLKPTPGAEPGGEGAVPGVDPSTVLVLNDPLKVFVVNAGDIGCCVRPQSRQRTKPSRSRRRSPQHRTTQPPAPQRQSRSRSRRGRTRLIPRAAPMTRSEPRALPSLPRKAPVPVPAESSAGKIGTVIKGIRGPAILEAGIKTVATAMTAQTPEEKAEGYGAAAGGLVGTVLGGMIGSVVPVVGTSMGALLGGMAGDAIGGWIGKRIVASGDKPAPSAAQADSAAPVVRQPGEVVRSLVGTVPAAVTLPILANTPAPALSQPQQLSQQFTFTPNMPITVQGGVTDPLLLAQNLQVMVRREFEELMRMATSRQLSDVPHVQM